MEISCHVMTSTVETEKGSLVLGSVVPKLHKKAVNYYGHIEVRP